MKRWMYRAWSENEEEAAAYWHHAAGEREALLALMREAGVSALSVFGGDRHWFLYAETEHDPDKDEIAFEPESLFPEAASVLTAWPGEEKRRFFVPMTDIFHYQQPISQEHWRRKSISESYGRMARLRPDQISSYVFYHYQYQEEKPGDGDQYGMIGLSENLLFFYAERPSTLQPAPYEGKLQTQNTPKDWAAVMQPHFIEWAGVVQDQKIWLNLKRMFDVRIDEIGKTS